MNYDKLLTKIIFIDGDNSIKSGRLASISCRLVKGSVNGRYSNILKYLWDKFPDSQCIRELFFRLRDNIIKRPVCPICGKALKFCGHIGQDQLYYKHCSAKCSRKDKDVLNKAKQTCLARYGENNLTNRVKYKNTCLEKYGVDNYWKLDSSQKKCKNTIIERYGTLYNREKIEKTNLEKYKVKQVLELKSIHDKSKNTWIRKYGVDHPMKAKEVKEKYNWISIVEKVYNTKKKNNSFRNTKPEQEIYAVLSKKFNNIQREYKSKEYPFSCDFYIPDLDLYIEYNGYWTHGGKKYEGTKEDLEKINDWRIKSKTNPQYLNAINTWTKRDISKFNIAEQNNLNYLVFYNLTEFYSWLSENGI